MEPLVASFVRRLHAATRRRCFTSGAFVLEVPAASTRFQRFLQGLVTSSSVRRGARTHDDFQRPERLAARRLCGRACARGVSDLSAGRQREFAFRAPLRGLCGQPTDEAKRVMLWYLFGTGGKRYMYVKLESHPALSVQHAVAAASRYLLKRQKKTAYASRRENAYKDGNLVPAAALAMSRENAAALWPHLAAPAAGYDATLRIGREMFVPAAAVARLV